MPCHFERPQVGPLASYSGEGLAALVEGKVFEEAYDLELQVGRGGRGGGWAVGWGGSGPRSYAMAGRGVFAVVHELLLQDAQVAAWALWNLVLIHSCLALKLKSLLMHPPKPGNPEPHPPQGFKAQAAARSNAGLWAVPAAVLYAAVVASKLARSLKPGAAAPAAGAAN